MQAGKKLIGATHSPEPPFDAEIDRSAAHSTERPVSAWRLAGAVVALGDQRT